VEVNSALAGRWELLLDGVCEKEQKIIVLLMACHVIDHPGLQRMGSDGTLTRPRNRGDFG
jgi:hypothetical protein